RPPPPDSNPMHDLSELPNRKSLRMRGYDYSRAGAYFVTICSHHHHCTLGSVVGGHTPLTSIGKIVLEVWNALPERFPGLILDEFAIMPNHLHGVLGFVGAGLAPPVSTSSPPLSLHYSLADVVGAFKSISTIRVNRGLGQKGKPLWQRGYYEHIIRSGEDLKNIQRYIMENPMMWALDRENPASKSR
ncbi:MAG TPA: transposase, partial [Candidatus Angelobacter sp.]|nr:transposase [Candidatus Angelobacter sp.]